MHVDLTGVVHGIDLRDERQKRNVIHEAASALLV